jgi:hypothetical protein
MYAVAVCLCFLVVRCASHATAASDSSGSFVLAYVLIALAFRIALHLRQTWRVSALLRAEKAKYESRFGLEALDATVRRRGASVYRTTTAIQLGGWKGGLIVGGIVALAEVVDRRSKSDEQREHERRISSYHDAITWQRVRTFFSVAAIGLSCVLIEVIVGVSYAITR